MKIIQVQNHPRYGGGAGIVFEMTKHTLLSQGECVISFDKNSRNLGHGLRGKLQAFTGGLYSNSAYKNMAQLIEKEKPDIVHVHDLYPLLVWSLPACKKAGIPVIMTCHNYRLTCPTLFHFHNGQICERCFCGKEYWCILKNCRGNLFESIAFASHNIVARKCDLFTENINIFINLSNFGKKRLKEANFPDNKLSVLPNTVNIPSSPIDPSLGSYAAYVGRFSKEKGVETLLGAAKITPGVPVFLAGDYTRTPGLVTRGSGNIKFCGHLSGFELTAFYRKSRFLIIPSIWFEACPMVVIEAMGHGLPILASMIGALQELVEDGVTGLLFQPNSIEDLSEKMKLLWENPTLCREMGRAGREKAMREYNSDSYYTRLMSIYKEAVS